MEDNKCSSCVLESCGKNYWKCYKCQCYDNFPYWKAKPKEIPVVKHSELPQLEIWFSCPYCGMCYEKVKVFEINKVECPRCQNIFKIDYEDTMTKNFIISDKFVELKD